MAPDLPVILEGDNRASTLLECYKNVFKEELGTDSIHKVKLHARSDAVSKFFKPHSMLFSTKGIIGAEFNCLEAEGTLDKVSHSEWAAPHVAVPIHTLHMCGDYKVTINQDLEADQYPLPKPEELFTSLTEGQQFSKLDLSPAYQQLLLDEDSRNYTINTHKGYTVYSIHVGLLAWHQHQRCSRRLQGISHVISYLDDILVTSADHAEHEQFGKGELPGAPWDAIKAVKM